MKAFRGTLLALLALAALIGAYFAVKPHELTPLERKDLKGKEEGAPLFVFEKADLTRVEVERSDGPIVLVEKEDGWWIEGENLRASKSMVNRVKHQLHDLVSRATVVDDPEERALYGLGQSAIHVKLTFRDGSTREFDAGDPNPSGVSFYIHPKDSDAIYTVKKSAVDYYSLSLAEFRERRFATFDSKDVDAIDAKLPEGRVLQLQRTGERDWDLLAPAKFPANDSEIRSLLGRVSAMKAIQFVADDDTDFAKYGLDKPRAEIAIKFSAREPLTLLLGKPTGEKDGEYALAYAKLAAEPAIYAVRDGLLEDYLKPVESLRLTRFARMDSNALTTLVATFAPFDADDKDLAGTVTVKQAAGAWQWDDGVLVPGSTPRRVASRAAEIESDEFVAEAGEDKAWGFDKPTVKIVMTDETNAVRTLLVGKSAPPKVDPEGNDRARWYARVGEFPEVYIVDDGVVDVTKDLMREHGRHARGEEEEEERHDRIDREHGAAETDGPPGLPPRPGMPPGRHPGGRPDAPAGGHAPADVPPGKKATPAPKSP